MAVTQSEVVRCGPRTPWDWEGEEISDFFVLSPSVIISLSLSCILFISLSFQTTVLSEVVCESVRRGERVLLCGPSNLSVDNAIERIKKREREREREMEREMDGERERERERTSKAMRIVRIGHPARILASTKHVETALDTL